MLHVIGLKLPRIDLRSILETALLNGLATLFAQYELNQAFIRSREKAYCHVGLWTYKCQEDVDSYWDGIT